MPNCGSQIILCDLPIRIDTYTGCQHGCKYCFVKRKADIDCISGGESPKSIINFINGKRNSETNWCDWEIPLHWGGLSDPFQPIEAKYKRSLEVLKVFAETQYPFVVSTKGILAGKDPWYSLLGQCNCVLQISLVSPKYDVIEPGAPKFAERLDLVKKLCKLGKRLIIRIQPYITDVFKDVIAAIPKYADVGVYGVTIEGMKYFSKKPGLVKVGGDFCYPVDVLKHHYEAIRNTCHKNGLKFFCAENRLRSMGDALCCCGADGAFQEKHHVNRFNLNHFLYDNANYKPTKGMLEAGSAYCFKAMMQDTISQGVLSNSSLEKIMNLSTKDTTKLKTLGYEPKK